MFCHSVCRYDIENSSSQIINEFRGLRIFLSVLLVAARLHGEQSLLLCTLEPVSGHIIFSGSTFINTHKEFPTLTCGLVVQSRIQMVYNKKSTRSGPSFIPPVTTLVFIVFSRKRENNNILGEKSSRPHTFAIHFSPTATTIKTTTRGRTTIHFSFFILTVTLLF